MFSSTSHTQLLSFCFCKPSTQRHRFLLQSTSNDNLNLFKNRGLLSTLSFSHLQAVLNSSTSLITKEEEEEEQFDPKSNHFLTLRELCQNYVPEPVLHRMEEIGYVMPTDVQRQALPVLFSGQDCILHGQTGSGKTLAYLLLIYSVINAQRSAVQALIIVPTRELGMQVTKVARMLAAKPMDVTVMALLDGGMLRRHKSWLKAEPPKIVVATIASLCQMLEKHIFKLDSMQVLVIDEVDFMFNSSKQVSSLRKLLTSYSSCNSRQTVFASASIPQHRRFLYDCIQQKWTKICSKNQRHQILLSLLQCDAPKSGIVFVGEQSEKSKKAGHAPPTTLLVDFLETSYSDCSDILLLEEDMNFNLRAASLSEVKQGGGYLLVATDIAARGVDLPETTHIYNFELPRTAVDYLHRAGRTGRKPFSDEKCYATNIITPEERFVLQRYENELMFNCEELIL
ncbi:DEAD-box ATP-dependent RNA helicase 58, chloroplastic isoform X1 [Ricinus communis]|uniref:DEAD-box ATP-dependent RNA helicase 58, chloroplastic isoform X1 n=1 Tax=Ricinus communis TaxID=3988 RepID=UPI000D68CBB1|nr:DEAD-box ATP-dependent RNA helicase 58, chloroplastic isoform X1 [Ricinus communis]|eukprot:XP_025012744.1 DEAD-box ATP-dependent RNA helicase 58, chloroplastic isoform X2 [Ricinus communis]